MKDRGLILILYLKTWSDIGSPLRAHCSSRCFRVADHSRPVAMADYCYCPGPCWAHKIVQQSTSLLRPLVDSRVGCKFGQQPSSVGQLWNWALCKSSFEPKSVNSQKSENLQWEKYRYITDIEKTFSDTAQYFHSKHLRNLLKCHEKHVFQCNGVSGPERYFPKLIASCSFMLT